MYPYVSGEFKPSEYQKTRVGLSESGYDEQGKKHKLYKVL